MGRTTERWMVNIFSLGIISNPFPGVKKHRTCPVKSVVERALENRNRCPIISLRILVKPNTFSNPATVSN